MPVSEEVDELVRAGRVRELFQAARAVAPAIIFIDEIDAIGRRRGVRPNAAHVALAQLERGELFGERLQLDANREAALQFGNQIARLGHVERPGGHEQEPQA